MLEDKPSPPVAETPRAPNSWTVIVAGLLVCAASVVLLAIVMSRHLETRRMNLRETTEERARQIEELLRANLVKPEQIRRSVMQRMDTENASWYSTQFTVEAEGVDPDGLVSVLERGMTRGRAYVEVAEEGYNVRRISFFLAGLRFAEVELHVPPPPPLPEMREDDPVLIRLMALAGIGEPEPPAAPGPKRPRVAIILDDGGYGGSVTEAVLKLDPGLTLSILPGAPDAAETARKAAAAKFEVMLHLPMESPEDPGWVSVSTPRDEMARLVDEAMAQVPGAVGINNHMGSAFCADGQALARFFDVIKSRPLFFIDSRTTAETRIPDAARQAGVRVGERKVFLDNDGENGKIREQFDRLVQFALQEGTAIGIGHFRQSTVEALRELLPELTKHGISLVHASEVVQ